MTFLFTPDFFGFFGRVRVRTGFGYARIGNPPEGSRKRLSGPGITLGQIIESLTSENQAKVFWGAGDETGEIRTLRRRLPPAKKKLEPFIAFTQILEPFSRKLESTRKNSNPSSPRPSRAKKIEPFTVFSPKFEPFT